MYTVRATVPALALLALQLFSGCTSSTSGVSGRASYHASECGGVLSDLSGCDLTNPLAQGGQVTVSATDQRSGQGLDLRSDNPTILAVSGQAPSYTLSALAPGHAGLIAFDPTGDLDRLDIEVASIALLAFVNGLSSANGTFTMTPTGDTNAMFAVNAGISQFSLFFAQVDAQGRKLLGRSSFTYDLGGLMLAGSAPTALQFDLQRPPPGSYVLDIKAKIGAAQYRMKVVVN